MQKKQIRKSLVKSSISKILFILLSSALLILGVLGLIFDRYLGASIVSILASIVLLTYHILKEKRELHDPTILQIEGMEELAKGNLNVDFSVGPHATDMVRIAGQNLEELARSVEEVVSRIRDTSDLQDSILSGLNEGVLATDMRGKIRLETEKVSELLARTTEAQIEHIFLRNFNYNRVWSLMVEAMDRNETVEEEVNIHSEFGTKIVEVYATPLMREEEMDGALAVLRDVTRMKHLESVRKDFVGNVTHELKTPLTSIRGYVDLIDNPNRTTEEIQQFTQIIGIEAERLQRLIEDLLELSEIEAGDREYSKVDYTYLYQAADEAIEDVYLLANKKRINIHLEIDPDLRIQANPRRIQQLLVNLISNAIKYNNDGGDVWIRSNVEKNRVMLIVEDNGFGIPEEDQERIFERFYRVDKSRNQEVEGTGLGLSIVKHIANLYGGQVVLDSEVDKSTKFTVIFPRTTADEN